jgi:hypothetical protein
MQAATLAVVARQHVLQRGADEEELLAQSQLAPGRRIVVDVLDTDEIDLSVSARFVEFAAETAEPAALVELEDPLDGVDEVPGPPLAEAPGATLPGETEAPADAGPASADAAPDEGFPSAPGAAAAAA